MEDAMLTTYDNPYNPFTEFDSWLKRDLILGHDCCGLLAKYSNTSEVLSDELNEESIDQAMKEIVKEEPMVYRIVIEKDYKENKGVE